MVRKGQKMFTSEKCKIRSQEIAILV